MSRYQYYRSSECFSPNSMSYVERSYEAQLEGDENPIGQSLDLQSPTTMHHKICDGMRYRGVKAQLVNSAYPLIDHYRRYGHLAVNLGLFTGSNQMPAEPKFDGELQGKLGNNIHQLPAAAWSSRLRDIYCNAIAFEFMHCEPDVQKWFIQVVENKKYYPDQDALLKGFSDVVRAAKLESFLDINFVGQKRFSLEGCEALVALLERLIADQLIAGYDDVVIGMSHRGRINTLVNTLGFKLSAIVAKFDGSYVPDSYSGDVKYHLGHSVDRLIDNRHVHIALGFNPSHLEAINPVVMGNVRARIDRKQSRPFAILVHGDAAVSGQGVVMETLSMSDVHAYRINGVFHVVVNNQIGFTTNPLDGRSTTYCTDIAKMISAPVLHVRADDLGAILQAVKIAVAYRCQFHKDIFIDLIGYRKYGHNEADEPRATQPLMYADISKRESIIEILKKELVGKGLAKEKLDAVEKEIEKRVADKEALIDSVDGKNSTRELDWNLYQSSSWRTDLIKEVKLEDLKKAATVVSEIPPDMCLQRLVEKVMLKRQEMAKGDSAINWGMAELIAYQYLINSGYSVRLVGQDCIRGTFAHRHAAVFDQKTGQMHRCVADTEDAKFMNYNSILSEYAALGFEYGYAETDPRSLVIFEAQFGDFINGAQIIIDQFISSSCQKWQRFCGLVMLLPHGYEGQGPEHSSARLERFMQLASEQSIQICVPSTAAQIFRLLVRQVLRPYRRPLIVMTPKSLLRLEQASSSFDDLRAGYEVAIPAENPNFNAECILLCAGKIYYDILAYAQSKELRCEVIRVEQLYPFPDDEIGLILEKYKQLKVVKWCQEEPLNQGAWQGVRDQLDALLSKDVKLAVCARPESASPAAGYMSVHQAQQRNLMELIFAEDKG